jgi:hypothetical protein
MTMRTLNARHSADSDDTDAQDGRMYASQRMSAGSELDLTARLAGLRLRERYQDWDRGPFTGESQDHISVYEVTAAPGG